MTPPLPLKPVSMKPSAEVQREATQGKFNAAYDVGYCDGFTYCVGMSEKRELAIVARLEEIRYNSALNQNLKGAYGNLLLDLQELIAELRGKK